MATKLYLHKAANSGTGTFPTNEQSSSTADVVGSVIATSQLATLMRTMNTTKGTGPQENMEADTLSGTSAQTSFMGYFCSPTFQTAQNVGGASQTVTLNLAVLESNLATNYGTMTCNIYVWRPSTGAKVGTIGDRIAMTGMVEPTVTDVYRVDQGTMATTTQVAALAGDVLVCEIWCTYTQGGGPNGIGVCYDGSTQNTINNTTVTNHASFLNFSSDTMVFGTPSSFISGAFSKTLTSIGLTTSGDVTVTGVFDDPLATVVLTTNGDVAVAGSFSASLANAALGATGDIRVNGLFNVTMANASLSAAGSLSSTVYTGNFNVTLGSVGLSAAGSIGTHGTAALTLAAATLSAAGSIGTHGTAALTLAAASLSATGSLSDLVYTGNLNTTLASIGLSAAGGVVVGGDTSITLADAAIAGTGVVTALPGAMGNFSVTLGNATVSATASVGVRGTLAATLAAVTASASGSVRVRGVSALTLATLGLASTGNITGDAPPLPAEPLQGGFGVVGDQEQQQKKIRRQFLEGDRPLPSSKAIRRFSPIDSHDDTVEDVSPPSARTVLASAINAGNGDYAALPGTFISALQDPEEDDIDLMLILALIA